MPSPGEVSAEPGDLERRVTWTLVEAVPGPAVLVEVRIGGPPCDVVTAVDVEESPDAVGLTVWAGRERGARCRGVPATLGTFHLRVPLAEPLGTRTLEPS